MSVFARERRVLGSSGQTSPAGPDGTRQHARPRPEGLHVGMFDVDVADGLVAIPARDADGVPWTSALVLVRIFTEPVGVIGLRVPPRGVSVEELARRIECELGEVVRDRMSACGLRRQGALPTAGLRPPQVPAFVLGRERVLSEAPSITVAVCTRDRPQGLSRCLASLARQEYPALSIVVVDNDPSDDRSRAVAAQYRQQLDLEYVVEPRPGLSWARNKSIDVSSSEIIAWIDDDEDSCDPWWVAELARAFVEQPDADAAAGMIMPAEIETRAQLLFEQYGGHSKGRGFEREVFVDARGASQSPLLPLPPFGTGGNMAFRREAVELIGRFDCALGAGTPTLAGEDTAAFSALLLKGGTVVWQPSALLRHWHRRDMPALSDLQHGYGRGLGAFYTSMAVRHPASIPRLIGLAPRALFEFLSPRGQRRAAVGDDYPRELLRAHRAGLLRGPATYARACRQARRLEQAVGAHP